MAINTFWWQWMGWLMRTNKAREVDKKLLHKIIPTFGLRCKIKSDNGHHFVVQIVEETAQAFNIKWNHHTPWQPQASWQLERW